MVDTRRRVTRSTIPTKRTLRTLPPTAAWHPHDPPRRNRADGNKYLKQSKTQNTRRVCRADWAGFTVWCEKYRLELLLALPDTVAYYFAYRSRDLKTRTLQRRLATITEAHSAAGLESPNKSAQVRLVWAGTRREKGVAQNHKKPTLTNHIREMVENLPDG